MSVLFLEVRTYGFSRNGRTREGMIADRSARFQKTLLKLIERLCMLLDRAEHMTRKEGFSHRCPARAVDNFEELFGEVLRFELRETFARCLNALFKFGYVGRFHDLFTFCTYVEAVSREDGRGRVALIQKLAFASPRSNTPIG